MSKEKPNPYVELLHGRPVRLTTLNRDVPYTIPALEAFMLNHSVVGQFMLPFESEDIVFWMPNEKRLAEGMVNARIKTIQSELKDLDRVR